MKATFNLELRALDSTCMEKIRAWRNDFRVWRWTRQNEFISDVEQEAWFKRQVADPTIRMYAIHARFNGTDMMIGVCGLTSLDMANRRAEFSLYIGPEFQQRGYGKGALKLLLHHGFVNLGLNQIWGETFDGNPAARMFESLGLRHDGTRREFYWKDGRFWDAHLYSILWSDYARLHSGPDQRERPANNPDLPSVDESGDEGDPSGPEAA